MWRKIHRSAGLCSAVAPTLDMPSAGWEILGKLPASSVPAFHLHKQQQDTYLAVRIKGGSVCGLLFFFFFFWSFEGRTCII